MAIECPDSYGSRCNLDGNINSCQIRTKSGSCDNCGTLCPGATADSEYPCCLDIEIPPTRRPEFIEISPGSCEYNRILDQWVWKYMRI